MRGGSSIPERRKHRRSLIRLPVQIDDARGNALLARGQTLDLSPGGLLAECPDVATLHVDQPVSVHVGLPPEAWADGDGRFPGRVKRITRGASSRCAIEVTASCPAFLLFPELIGSDPSILEAKRGLADIAGCGANVLIRGESGTGKSVAARLIHDHSSRARYPFVRQNCPSIPETLMESQLFGHDRGAFTDAKSPSPGMFRLAHKGTLVLEEISTLPCSMQAKLLQAIEEKRFFPVGASREVDVDVRVVATTNDDLEAMMRRGTFRGDLFYRLNELSVTLPALRDRAGDVPLLADYFLRKYSAEFGKPYRPLERSTLEALLACPWPGNVRELENVVKRHVLTGPLELHVPRPVESRPAIPAPGPVIADALRGVRRLKAQLASAERAALRQALDATGQNRTRAAAALGISYRTLLRKLKQYQFQS